MDKNSLSLSLFGGLIVSCIVCTLAQESQKPSQQYPVPSAQKRMGGMFDSLFGGGGSAPAEPAGVPSGFGMYPLWKFHKFDGFSLRPVPIQMDIGHGIPPPPQPVMPSYGGPPPYSPPPPPPYSPPPPPPYSPPPSSGYAPSGGYGGGYVSKPPLTMGYKHTGNNYDLVLPSYSESSSYEQQPPYSAPANAPSYGPSQPSYSGNQQIYTPSGPPTYDEPSYGSQGYSGPELSYAGSNPQPATTFSGGFGSSGKVPSYAAFDGNNGNSFNGLSVELSMPMESNKGGYLKRFYNTDSDAPDSQQPTNTSDGAEQSAKQ